MLHLIIKAALSGVIIAAASEVARRTPAVGAVIVSLPLVSILALIWLWQDGGSSERVAAFAQSTFWYVLPTLPMFLLMPLLLRHGLSFWPTLAACSALTFLLYLSTIWALKQFGVTL